jgi:hypothetical protein
VLEQARAATTAAQMDAALEGIEALKGEIASQREGFKLQLQEAIIAGEDLTKPQANITHCSTDIDTLEAAHVAFSKRRDQLAAAQADAELEGIRQRLVRNRAAYAKQLKEMERGANILIASHAAVDRLRKDINNDNDTLVAAGAHKEIVRPRKIAADTLGEPVRHIMTSRFGQRADQLLRMFMNAFKTGQDARVWGKRRPLWGRPGETQGARSQFMAGALSQKRKIG